MKQRYIKLVLGLILIAVSLTTSAHLVGSESAISVEVADRLTGIVRDSLTNEPIPYASISYEGKGIGSISDLNGAYRITTRKGWNEVTFTAVGYRKKIVKFVPGVTQKLNVKLQPSDVQLKEIVVKPKKEKYSRKNNPAVELMRKVIANKSNQRLEENDFYQYDKYQKMTTSLNNVDPDNFDKGIYKKMPFLVNQVEPCIETNKLILPFSVEETASQKVFRKNPKDEKTLVKGVNSSGVNELFSTGDAMGAILKDIFADVNIYDDDIRLLASRFISPISSKSAISFYKYYIMDTVRVDKDSCIHLTFVPNNSQDFGFTGHLYIIKDSTYAVKKCTMNLPKKTGVNFVENLDIIQSYEQLPNGEWVLKDDDMIAELTVVKGQLQVRRTTRYSNYAFNEVSPKVFKLKGSTVKDVDAMMKGDEFWKDVRPVPLTDKENGMDMFIKHLEEIPGFKYAIIGLRALIENFIETGSKDHPSKFDFGPMNTIIGSNSIEGLRLRLSGQTTAKLFPQLFFSGYYAYGFKDNKSKYKGTVEYTFDKKEFLAREFPKHSISASYMYDVMSPMDKFLKTDKDNMFVGLKTTTVDQMSYIRDVSFKYERETMSGFSVAMTVNNRNDEPTGNLFYIKNDGAQVPNVVHDITTTETSLQLRFAPGETFINTKQRRLPINFDAPIFTLSHTMGIKDVMGGDYNFNLTEAGVYKRFWLSSWGRLDAFVKAGKQWDKVPFPLLIMPAANLSYITQRETFNLINNMEFLNDKFASLDLTYDMNGKIFNRIPLIKRLKLREIFKFKALYGSLSDKNNPDKSDGLFLFPTRNGQTTSFPMGKDPYMEFSVGIYNIFKILHVEYTRRLNYLDHPGINKDGIRIAMLLNF